MMQKVGILLLIMMLGVILIAESGILYAQELHQRDNDVVVTQAQKILLITGKAKKAADGSIEYIYSDEEKMRRAILKTKNILKITGKIDTLPENGHPTVVI